MRVFYLLELYNECKNNRYNVDFTSITSKLILNLYIVFHIIRKLIIYNNLIYNKISKFFGKDNLYCE